MNKRILAGVVCGVALTAAVAVPLVALGAGSAPVAGAPWILQDIPEYQGRTIGPHVSMALTEDGNAVIAYETDSTPDLLITRWTPGSNTDLSQTLYDGAHNSIAVFHTVDNKIKVIVVYYDSASYTFRYNIVTYSAQWAYLSTDSGYIETGSMFARRGYYASVQYDSTGVAHVAYYYSNSLGDDALKYAHRVADGTGNCGTDSNWQCDTIQTAEGLGRYASLDVDGSDTPHIAYHVGTNDSPWVASYVGSSGNCGPGNSWECDEVQRAGLETGEYVSLAVEDDGTPHIAYHNATSNTLEYATYVESGGNCGYNNILFVYEWKCTTIEGIGTFASEVRRPIDIELDQGDLPVIAYQDAGVSPTVLRVARPFLAYVGGFIPTPNCGPSTGFVYTWYCQTVDPGSAGVHEGSAVALEVDSRGFAVIAYRELDTGPEPDEGNLRVAYQRLLVFLPIVLKN